MTQQDKDLLLRDLCARLPYGIKVAFEEDGELIIDTITMIGWPSDEFMLYEASEFFTIDGIKPYLRPISSMTEDEVNKLFKILKINEDNEKEWLKVNDINIIRLFTEEGKDFYEIAEALDYLNSIHVDYRELIEKCLAIEVTDENNPYK